MKANNCGSFNRGVTSLKTIPGLGKSRTSLIPDLRSSSLIGKRGKRERVCVFSVELKVTYLYIVF